MSLILEALKKVERERATPEQRGFLVLGPAAWTPSRSNVGMILGMAAAAIVAGGAVYLLTRPDASPPSVRPGENAAAPAPAPQRLDLPAAGSAWEPPPVSSAPRPRPAAGAPATASVSQDGAPATRVLTLNAISEQGGVPIAVVNDRVVREGETFDGIRVLRIRASEVEVEVDGARRILRF